MATISESRAEVAALRSANLDVAQRATVLINGAVQAAGHRNFYLAWDYLQQAERTCAEIIDDELGLHALKTRYAAEGKEKLTGLREDASNQLAKGESTAKTLIALMRLVHQGSQNQQQKIELIREQSAAALVLLLFVLMSLLCFAAAGGLDWISGSEQSSAPMAQVLCSGVLIALLGAAISACFALTGMDSGMKVPVMRSALSVQVLRAAVGAATGVPVVLMMRAGLINLGPTEAQTLPVVCFVAGFSERWFIARLDEFIGSKRSVRKGGANSGGY